MITLRYSMLIILSLLAGLLPVTSRAQDEGSVFDPTQAEGIEAGIYREYRAGGLQAIALGTPEPAFSLTIQVGILHFDTADHARAMLEKIAKEFTSYVDAASAEERAMVVRAESITNYGDDGYELRISETSEDGTFHVQILMVAHGEYLFTFSAEGNDDIQFTITHDLMTYLTEIGEPGGEPVLSEEGGSSGGLWGFFPEADNPLLMGMLNVADDLVFPVPAGTEEE